MKYLTDEDYKIAESNGINRDAAYKRFYNIGWSKEKAITIPLGATKKPPFTEEEYRIARNNGIKQSTVSNRYYALGWDKEKCITEPIKTIREEDLLVHVAMRNGIKSATYYSRLKNGWGKEEAATTPVLTSKEIAEKNRQSTRIYEPWVYEEMEKNNISKNTLHARVHSKWTVEEACRVPVGSKLVDYYRNRVKELESQLG